MAITTAIAWKVYRGVADTTYDAIVGALIPTVQDKVERYLGTAIDSATFTDEAYDGDGSQELWLKNYPVTAVSAVKIVSDDGTTTTLASADYRWSSQGKIVRLPYYGGMLPTRDSWGDPIGLGGGSVFPNGFQNVKVTYTAGYGTVPDDLQYAAFVMIDAMLAGQGVDIFAQQVAEGNENRVARSAEEALQIYRQLLGPFRRMP